MTFATPRALLSALLALVLGLGLLVGLPAPADAATITVARTDDPAPGTAGQCGSPATNGSSDCSLRQAIRRANAQGGADEIVLPAGTYVLSQVGADEEDGLTGDIDVLDHLTITGAGSGTTTVSGSGMHGGGPDRLLDVRGPLDVTITGVTFTLGEANTIGGALYNRGGTVDMTDVHFVDNATTAGGGGAIANHSGTVTLRDGRLEDNETAGDYGGAAFNYVEDDGGPIVATMTILDSVVTGNTSDGYGGAFHTEAAGSSTAHLRIERSEVTENTATSCCGGAVNVDPGSFGIGTNDARMTVTIIDSMVDGNRALDCCGGAIYAEGFSAAPVDQIVVDLQGSTFDGNSTIKPGTDMGCCGSAVFVDDATLEATDTSFTNNTDDDCCGAVYLDDAAGELRRVVIDDNVVSGENDGQGCCGGGLAVYGDSDVLVEDSVMRRNSVDDDCCGGAMDLGGGTITIRRTTIDANTSAGCCGGAMEIYSDAQVTIEDSTVSNNAETTGRPNSGQDNGGGAVALYTSTSSLTAINTTFSGNSTAETGGAIFIDAGTVSLIHSTVTDNSAALGGTAIGVGEATSTGSDATFISVNSIIDGTCTRGSLSTITSGGGNVATDASCELDEASDQLVADVLLGPLDDNGGPTLTHALLPGSPALDAGTAPTMDDVDADQRGVTRPLDGDGAGGAQPDAGAVEAILVDVSLDKSVSPSTMFDDQVATWTVSASNDGLQAAEVVVTDDLPDGLTFVDSDDCTEDAGTVTCDLGAVAPSSTADATFTTTGDAGTYDNAAVIGLDPRVTDADDTDDTASATLTVVARQSPLPGGEERLFGTNRIDTAVAVSDQTYADGAAGAVVLARADLYPDALAGTPLAVQEDAPLLLTSPTSLTEATATEIQRVLPAGGTVYLLGGVGAVSEDVEEAVEALGYVVVRLAGDTRYETATVIAEQGLDGFGEVFLVTGVNFPDAVASGAAAGAVDGAIVLTADETVPDATATFLAGLPSGTPVWAVGGPAARAQEGDTDIVGDDRIATALLVAEQFFDDPPVAGVATGYAFPDALTGGAQLGAYGGPMLLSRQDRLADEVGTYLAALPDDATVFLYGGPAALSDAVQAAVEAARP